MRPLIFFFQSPVNGSFRDQFEKLNGELLYLACPTRAFRKSSSWSKSKLINARGVVAIFLLSSSQLGVISYDGRYVSSGYLPSMFCALEVWPETRFSPSRRFPNVDCRCNSGFLKRIAYTTMPYKTGLGLLGVARNPANGFPARLLGCTNMPTRLVVPDWFTISQGRWLETALFTAMAVNPHSP